MDSSDPAAAHAIELRAGSYSLMQAAALPSNYRRRRGKGKKNEQGLKEVMEGKALGQDRRLTLFAGRAKLGVARDQHGGHPPMPCR